MGFLITLTLTLAAAEDLPAPAPPSMPPVPAREAIQYASPIEEFRALLQASPAQRAQWLAARRPAQRESLVAKIREYEALPAAERELRLRVLQLRYYLVPLMKLPAAQRPALAAKLPADLRPLIQERLKEWDLLPPPLQEEALENDTARQYFLRLETPPPAGRETVDGFPPQTQRPPFEERLARWQLLPPDERDRILSRFQRFFDLPEGEQQKVIETLDAADRRRIETMMAALPKLDLEERQYYFQAVQKLADSTPAQRELFFRNLERWQSMTLAERQTWREITTHLPPLPPGLLLELPPPPPHPGRLPPSGSGLK